VARGGTSLNHAILQALPRVPLIVAENELMCTVLQIKAVQGSDPGSILLDVLFLWRERRSVRAGVRLRPLSQDPMKPRRPPSIVQGGRRLNIARQSG